MSLFVGSSAADLYDAATDLLTVANAALVDSPGGPVQRAFVSVSAPAWDCPDQLTVHVGGPYVADTYPLQPSLQPGHRIVQSGQVDIVNLTVTILRCAPPQAANGAPPTPLALNAVAQVSYGDAWAIWNHIRQAKRNGTLFPPNERELFMEPSIALQTAGGILGWQLGVRIAIPGYTPA